MPNLKKKNTTMTAPTAIERVELFLSAHGGYTEPITSIRFYSNDYSAGIRNVTRVPLSADDLHELIRLARLAS